MSARAPAAARGRARRRRRRRSARCRSAGPRRGACSARRACRSPRRAQAEGEQARRRARGPRQHGERPRAAGAARGPSTSRVSAVPSTSPAACDGDVRVVAPAPCVGQPGRYLRLQVARRRRHGSVGHEEELLRCWLSSVCGHGVDDVGIAGRPALGGVEHGRSARPCTGASRRPAGRWLSLLNAPGSCVGVRPVRADAARIDGEVLGVDRVGRAQVVHRRRGVGRRVGRLRSPPRCWRRTR